MIQNLQLFLNATIFFEMKAKGIHQHTLIACCCTIASFPVCIATAKPHLLKANEGHCQILTLMFETTQFGDIFVCGPNQMGPSFDQSSATQGQISTVPLRPKTDKANMTKSTRQQSSFKR